MKINYLENRCLFSFFIAYSKGYSLTVHLCMCLTDTETYESLIFSLVLSLSE